MPLVEAVSSPSLGQILSMLEKDTKLLLWLDPNDPSTEVVFLKSDPDRGKLSVLQSGSTKEIDLEAVSSWAFR